MTVTEFKNLIKAYEDQALKSGKQRPLTKQEIEDIDQSIDNIPAEFSTAFNNAKEGNFSQFDSLPLILKTYLGAKSVAKLREDFKDDLSLNNEALKTYLKDHAMDVSLRAGISVEKTSKDEAKRETAGAFDTFMNTYVMQSTLMPPTEEQKQALKTSIGDAEANAALTKDLKRQRVLAKTFFLAQLGKYDILDDNGISRDFDQPLSETLVHGTRTNFILPAGTDSKKVIDAYVGNHDGQDPVVEKRTAATHHVTRRAVDKNGLITSETKEIATYNPLKVFGNQYGMDLSVGGIGKKGPDTRIISGNGESGHAYMRIEEGDKKHCASLLFGIEGSAPGKDSALGHSHGASGVSANQSAFFTDKQVPGRKHGGRQVDLSGIEMDALEGILKDFDKVYTELQEGASTPEGRAKLAEFNDKLIGKKMSTYELTEMCEKYEIGGPLVYSTVYDGQNGYLAKVKCFNMDKHALRQSIRATVSQKVACDLAEKRFKSSDDIHLSVGAIKELVCTHEARGFFWRLRHPILNHRENATIQDLTKRLVTEKNFTPEDIADAMNYHHDSFSMNWGKGLSNDHATCFFIKQKTVDFIGESTMGPVMKAMKKLVDKFYGAVNGLEAMQKRMESEVQEMQDFLDNKDMHTKEEDFFKRDREYRNRDDFDEEEEPAPEGPDEEFKKTPLIYAPLREKLHQDILKDFNNDFKDVRSPKVEEPEKKGPEKKI